MAKQLCAFRFLIFFKQRNKYSLAELPHFNEGDLDHALLFVCS
jgi:hypothetical protein